MKALVWSCWAVSWVGLALFWYFFKNTSKEGIGWAVFGASMTHSSILNLKCKSYFSFWNGFGATKNILEFWFAAKFLNSWLRFFGLISPERCLKQSTGDPGSKKLDLSVPSWAKLLLGSARNVSFVLLTVSAFFSFPAFPKTPLDFYLNRLKGSCTALLHFLRRQVLRDGFFGFFWAPNLVSTE